MKLDSMPRTSPIQISNGTNSFTRYWQIWLSQLYKGLNTRELKEEPIFAGVTIDSGVTKSARWLYDGTIVRIVVTLSGGTTESPSGSFLSLPFSAPFGICQVDDVTSNTQIGLGVVNENKIYLPAWVSMTNTVRITALCGAEETNDG